MKKEKYLVRTVLIISIVLFIFCNLYQAFWNPLDGDAVCFIPVAKNIIQGNGLINHLYHPAEVVDPSSPDKYIWHGPMFPLFLSIGYYFKEYQGIRILGLFISLACYISWLNVLSRGTNLAQQSVRLIQKTITILIVLIGMGWMFSFDGRPEILSILFTFPLAYLSSKSATKRSTIFLGLLMGLIALTTPGSAILLLPLLIITLMTHNKLRIVMHQLPLMGLICLIVILTTLSVTGINPIEWLKAMSLHSKHVVWNRSSQQWEDYWIFLHQSPFLIFTAIILLSGFIYHSYKKLAQNKASIYLASTLQILFFVLSYLIAIKAAPNYYHLKCSILFLATIVTPILFSLINHKKTTLLATILLSTCYLSSFVAFFRTPIVGLTSQQKKSVFETKKILLETLQNLHKIDDCRIAYRGLFEINDDIAEENKTLSYEQDINNCNADYLITQQANSGLTIPPEIDRYKLIYNYFNPNTPKLYGLPLARTDGTYGFAIYRKQN